MASGLGARVHGSRPQQQRKRSTDPAWHETVRHSVRAPAFRAPAFRGPAFRIACPGGGQNDRPARLVRQSGSCALIVAAERGYFRARDLEVELIARRPDGPQAGRRRAADLAITYRPNLHIQVAQGLPLVRIGTLVATPLNTLVTLDGGPVRSIADLKAARSGFSVGGFEDALLKAMLARHGLGLADITLVNVNFALSPALVSGQVDAVIGAFRNFELNQLALLGRQGRAFYVEEEGVPAYDELVLVANRTSVTTDPARFRRFIDAVEDGTRYLVNHPDESWRLFIARHRNLDDELNRRAWRDTLPRFALRPAALDSARYRRFPAFLVEQGLIPRVLPVQDYAIELP
ncbi:MAG: ABC transporter substrate-binding protein [Alphaproteobacteria bacterium]